MVVPGDDFGEVLAAAQRGDEHAFVCLFRSVQPALLRYLSTVAGPLADDVAAETWVGVVRNLRRFSGDEQGWRAWVFTIARARLRDEQRRSMRRPVATGAEELLETLVDRCDVPAAVEEILTTEAALGLIGRLPHDQAEVVLLRHVVGLDVDQVARIVGKRPGTVRVTAHRGLRRLADLLGPPARAPEQRTPVAAGNAAELPSDR